MKIGIFSGSFNPIHIGHLILANYISEFTDIDELWFMVTPQSPFKESKDLANENERLKMVSVAVEGYPKLKACDFEFSLPKPSYTVNTLKELNKTYPEHTFSLIIGADNWDVFSKWKNHEYIMDNHRIFIYPRLNYEINNVTDNIEILNAPIIEISSTFIRQSFSEGKNIKSFLPENTYNYILKKGLY